MKNGIIVLVLTFFGFAAQAQTQNLSPFNPYDPIIADCANCFFPQFGGPEYSTGTKFGLAIGLVKNIAPKLDLLTQLGYNYWEYQVSGLYGYYGIEIDPFEESNHMVSLALGQRFNYVELSSSSFYVATMLNLQTYFTGNHKNFALSIEPKVGWAKSIGEKSEFIIEAGYDQHLTSYDEFFNRRPGRFGFNIGYNIKLGKREQ